MSSKRFDQARPLVTLGIAAAVWLAAPIALRALARASFFEFTAPILADLSYVRDLQAYWGLRLHSQRELIEAGRDLARVNASYAFSVQQNAEMQAEIARLEGLLNLPPLPRYRFEHARVAQRDFSSWWQRLVIRKGRDFGLSAGDPVVFEGGVVGRIAEVHAYTSVVEMVSSPGVRIAAMLEGDSRPVAFQGGVNPVFGPARGEVSFLPLDVSLDPAAPRRLVTAGVGGVFPAGLFLGRVVRAEPSTDGLFKSGEVELDPRLSELTEVTVLVARAP